MDVYLLDTNVVSARYSTGHRCHKAALAFLQELETNSDKVAISTITLAEIETGFAQAEALGQPAELSRVNELRSFCAATEMYDFTKDVIEPYVLIRGELFRRYASPTRKGSRLKLKEKHPEE